MKKFTMILGVLAALLGVGLMSATPGCAFFQQQRQKIETMQQPEFDKLKSDVTAIAKLTMDQIKPKLSDEQKFYAIVAFKLIQEQSSAERARLLAKFFEDPARQQLGQLAIQAAFDLVEGATGQRLSLTSLGLSQREVELVDALLAGLVASLEEPV